ncbi:MAG TPA: AAA family ATPase [Novosphingobium sp.]|nr:AAA family ATPase [Novosphingobium sp.]
MPDIFLSYNREDQAQARRFAHALIAEGFDVWWDVALKAGEAYDEVTESALNQSPAVVVLWSPRSVQSRWVRAEATVAQRNGSFVPVMIEPCTRPVMFELTQSADLIGWDGATSDPAWQAFLGDVRAHLAKRSAPAKPAPRAPSPPHAGERRQLAVLSCALGSESHHNELDPEDWDHAVRQFRAAVTARLGTYDCAVSSNGATVTALFGLDAVAEEDALRAVRAALAIVEDVGAIALPGGVLAQPRLGVDCGPVVTGSADRPPSGPTLENAAQLQMQAPAGAVLVSTAVATMAGGYLRLERFGTRAFGVLGESETHTRFELSRARGLSRFVGRSEDFAQLAEALERSAQGSGQVVGVMAEAGAGKSRLCFEFTEDCRAQGIAVYAGSATQQGRNTPLLAALGVFRSFFGIETQDDAATARSKIEARALALDPKLASALPMMFDLVGYPDPERPASALDPEARQRQLVALARHLLTLASATRPTVMLVEDLHWIDDASAAFLEALVDAREGLRNLLVLNYRPEFRAAWMQNSACRQLSLAPLGETAVESLLSDLLGTDPSVAVLAAPIIEQTKGNPYFVEEIVQTLVETGKIAGSRGDCRLTGPFTRLEVPPTVKAVVAARIDRLPELARRVLQVAAVIGPTFPEPLLAATAKVSPGELSDALAQLKRNEFVVEQALFPVAEFAFKHPLTLEMAQASLIKATRREIHADVAGALEAQEAARLDEYAAELARHWEEAGEAMIAARWHRRAAERVVRTDFPASVWHWEKVRALAHAHLTTPDDYALIIPAYINLLNFNYRVGTDLDAAKAVLAEGQALATAIGDEGLKLTLALCYSRAVCAAGDAEEYYQLTLANHRTAFAADFGILPSLATILLTDGQAHTGRHVDSVGACEEALAMWPSELPREAWLSGTNPHTFFSFMRGIGLVWLGRLDEAQAQLAAAVTFAEADGTPEVIGWSSYALAQASHWSGDGAAALVHAQRVAEISEALGSPLLVLYRHFCFALAHRTLGEPGQAIPHARAAMDVVLRTERHWLGAVRMQLAWALLEDGQPGEAAEMARLATVDCVKGGTRHFAAEAWGVLAMALLARDGPTARSEIESALAKAEAAVTVGASPVIAPFLLEWRAALADASGATADARRLQNEARTAHAAQGAKLRAGAAPA